MAPDSAMTTDPRVVEIVREAIDDHESAEMRVIDGEWRAICFCDADLGPVMAGPLIQSGHDETVRLHEAHRAQAVLAALTAAGWSLLPPGGRSRVEWAWAYDLLGQRKAWCVSRERDEAERELAKHRELLPDDTAYLVERTVHEGPWQPSDTPGEPA